MFDSRGRGRGRGGLGGGSMRPEQPFRAYEDYDAAYASPRTQAGRGQYADRYRRPEGQQYHQDSMHRPQSGARGPAGPPGFNTTGGYQGLGPRRRPQQPYYPQGQPTPRNGWQAAGDGGRPQYASGAVATSSGRQRAPYTVPAAVADGAPASAPVSARSEPEAPSNPHFLTPLFPQAPRTRTDSCSAWALMVEASCQALEAVVGPFLEGALQELLGECWERELHGLGLPLPPFSAATCAELAGRCKALQERLPITIHKRVEAVAKAASSLASSPSSLEPEDVAAAHAAMKGMLQDCIKAMRLPSLLGAGSRQFAAFTAELLPHAESALLYYDMLVQDCSEAVAARQEARALAAGVGGSSPGDATALSLLA